MPAPNPNPPAGGEVLTVVERDGKFVLQGQSAKDWPQVVCKSTGDRGLLPSGVTNRARVIPKVGKFTIQVALFIRLDDGSFLMDFDESDWAIVSE